MTHLLALDCSSHTLSLAVYRDGHFYDYHQEVRQQHADLALPAISTLLADAGLQLQQLDAILFGKGPGAFTGLRIAAGLAQGLATAAALPVIGISTLDAVAMALPDGNGLAVLDARMGELYSAHYRCGQPCSPLQVCQAEALLPLDPGCHIAGDALGAFSALGNPLHPSMPHASDYIRLYLASPQRYPHGDGELLYVRDKVALTSDEQRERKRA